jgi:DNA polymerase III sliding clamp (beta) subunit (PCNA family)
MQIPAAGTPSAVDEVIRLLSGNADLEQAEVAVTGKKLLFRAGSVVFATGPHLARTADAEAELLVPALASANQGLTVQRDALLAAIRRVRVSADAETSAIGLRLGSSEVIVLARDKSGNSAQEAVDATWEGKDGRLVVLNHRYLSEALGAHPGAQCEFRLGPDAGRKRSLVLLRDKDAGADAVLMQGHPKSLGLT